MCHAKKVGGSLKGVAPLYSTNAKHHDLDGFRRDSDSEAGGNFQLDFSVGLSGLILITYIWFSRLGLDILIEWDSEDVRQRVGKRRSHGAGRSLPIC